MADLGSDPGRLLVVFGKINYKIVTTFAAPACDKCAALRPASRRVPAAILKGNGMKFPWFGTKARAPRLARWSTGVWSSGEPPQGYEAQVRAAYLGNPVAQRAVRLVAESAASAPLTGETGALRLLGRPNPGQTGADFIEGLATALLLHGNGFVTGDAMALHLLRPERISIEAGSDGWPAAYVYRTGAAAARFAPDQVLHLKIFHPLDDHFGLGCLGAAAGAVALHNAASKWNRSLLDNAARPSGALVFGGGDESWMSGEQFDRMRAEMDAQFAGAANAGRPMLLEGGLKWQPMSLTPAELDFVGAKEAAAREIALAFGVPPMLLGLPGDNSYANYSEANRALWRLTVLPLLGKILGGVSAFLGAVVDVDRDKVPSLSEDRARLWAQVTAADFLSADEKRAMVGL